MRGQAGTITKLEKAKRTERAPMLYDLTSLQREANNRFGFSARRTLAAAQRCYEEHKALTYPRTSSRYLTSDMIGELKPTAANVGRNPAYRTAAEYVRGLDKLPLGRVVADDKVGDHHAIIPTKGEHRVEKMSEDDRRVYDLVVRRFLAVFHPDAVFENTRVETTVADSTCSARAGGSCSCRAGAASTGSCPRARAATRTTRARTSSSRAWSAASGSTRARPRSWRSRPSRRGATPTRRCWARWRRPASSSTTTSCARP